MEQDIQKLKQRMAELVKNDNLQYDDIYKIKLEMDDLIDKYYFEQV
ncbi:MAG: Spo0E family sporulation regulatory protein-aspartic acid phosphatase [Clostridiales bacterium]|nr:Spo0E family sporulation regulatory protein-aspartic acid phosphatase [Clostridiales bacterium]